MWRTWNSCALVVGMVQLPWGTVWHFLKKLKVG